MLTQAWWCTLRDRRAGPAWGHHDLLLDMALQGSFRPGFHMWLTICCWFAVVVTIRSSASSSRDASTPSRNRARSTSTARHVPLSQPKQPKRGLFPSKSSYLLKKLRTFWGGDVPILWKRKQFPLWLRPLYPYEGSMHRRAVAHPGIGLFHIVDSPPLCAGIETNLWSRSPLTRSYEGTKGQSGFRRSDKLKVTRPLTKSSILGCGPH